MKCSRLSLKQFVCYYRNGKKLNVNNLAVIQFRRHGAMRCELWKFTLVHGEIIGLMRAKSLKLVRAIGSGTVVENSEKQLCIYANYATSS